MSKLDDFMTLIRECEKDVEGFTAFGFVTGNIEPTPEANTNLRAFAVGGTMEIAEALLHFMNQYKPVEKIIIMALAMKAKENFDNKIEISKKESNED